jgi:sulfur transfer protein SufE
MTESPTIEELERRLDKLCDEYLKHPHDRYLQREIIELARRLDELKESERKSESEPPAGVRVSPVSIYPLK